MRVTITSVRSAGSVMIVQFACGPGEGTAIWKGEKIAPFPGREYDAELDISLVIHLGENCTKEDDIKPSLKMLGDVVQVTGLVDRLYDDGMISFRLSPDCLSLVESAGVLPQPGDVLRMVIRPEELQLTPLGSY